jgi:hypothetical protein
MTRKIKIIQVWPLKRLSGTSVRQLLIIGGFTAGDLVWTMHHLKTLVVALVVAELGNLALKMSKLRS